MKDESPNRASYRALYRKTGRVSANQGLANTAKTPAALPSTRPGMTRGGGITAQRSYPLCLLPNTGITVGSNGRSPNRLNRLVGSGADRSLIQP